jgi:hypothetical protein
MYVKVAFFRGASLRPIPPGDSKSSDTRYIDIREGDELDEAQNGRLGEAGGRVARFPRVSILTTPHDRMWHQAALRRSAI